MFTLSFADGSHCYLHLYTKSFFCEKFLYKKKRKNNPFYVRSFALMKKANNSIATKLQVNLINNRDQKLKYFCVRHNSMTKLCRALLKYKN